MTRNHKVRIHDLGTIGFEDAWNYQKGLFNELLARKTEVVKDQNSLHHLIFCEHHPVYTVGRSGTEHNLLAGDEMLRSLGAKVIHIDRGGDITFHGPGQLVCYPIFDLGLLGSGVKRFVGLLEEAVITVLRHHDVKGDRLEGATGVWIDPLIPGKARKICAIGIRVSRAVTMHGLAFNLNNDLKWFSHINPCGFTDKQVTTLQKELGHPVDASRVKEQLAAEISALFGLTVVP
ncbi:MAG: lipoyl(octanoyl) transferase LipB [Bacteroidales bacterium]|nr:lipoyl(octanoyl) transferase LipB [Bacteroidales bacterium]